MKTKKPTIVILPNTTKEKMQAIVNLSAAVMDLARAINSVNVDVTISNNTFDHSSLTIKPE